MTLLAPLVVLAGTADIERVRELAKLSGSGFDPGAELERSWARLWVARAAGAPNGSVLGFALAWRAADEMHLLDLAVDPALQRRGVGRRLLDAVIDDARRENGRLVLLEVRASNGPALALYRSAGFFVTDVRRAYYSDNGEDAVLMRLELSSPPAPPAEEPRS
ncbi:MAG TPA: ribosomal protein S18-alanine N-acetyltransferase [Polyangiaceae bacterium]|jgi:ribosomal-protein-alanine N-acetyltransferase|nr:ribosomal protein S18-alanine N-acetyltransferase [Polyangiaceae bacterium]